MSSPSLFALQENHLLSHLKAATSTDGLHALVVDPHTHALLLRVTSKDALLRLVTSVEIITAPRKPQPFSRAVYLVHPLVLHLNCIAADAAARRYKCGALLLAPLSHWEDTARARLDKLVHESGAYLDSPPAFVPASMYPLEPRVFLADHVAQNPMPVYYNENCGDVVLPQIRKSARAIVNAVVAAGEYPLLRFYRSPHSTHAAARLPELLADEVQRQLDDHARHDPHYPPESVGDKPRAVLVVCDRALDLYAPLLHEFSYQAMAMDVVPQLEHEGKYTYTVQTEKGDTTETTATLDSEDDVWAAVRHMHIVEALEVIVTRIAHLIQNNPLMVDRAKAKTALDLMYVVAHLLGFDDERRLVTLHKTLIDECLDINARRKLAEFAADFEQTCCAEGTLFEGVRNTHLAADLVALLARDDLHVNDKVRLVLIYGLYRGGLPSTDFVKLAKFIGVKDSHIVSLVLRCFVNLYKLGFPVVKDSPRDPPVRTTTFHTINNDGTYNTSRFAPGLKSVLARAARFELDEDIFPYFRDKPLEEDSARPQLDRPGSMRNTRIRAQWAPTARTLPAHRPRVFCFVAGGVTYSEMRSVYELSAMQNKDFFLGSETVLRPRDFLIGLQDIDQVKTPGTLDLEIVKELYASQEAPEYLAERHERPRQERQEPSRPLSVEVPPLRRAPQAPPPLFPQPKVEEKKKLRLKRLFK